MRTLVNENTYIKECNKSIDSMYDKSDKEYKGILFDDSIYSDDIINNIIKRLNIKYNIEIKLSRKKGRPKTGYISYSSISW